MTHGASFAFPGSAGFESEFPEKLPRVGGVWGNERYFSASMMALTAAGYAAISATTWPPTRPPQARRARRDRRGRNLFTFRQSG